MSDVSSDNIGIRISLVGGRVAAIEAEGLAGSIRKVGDATVEADVKSRAAAGTSGGLGLFGRAVRGINTSIAGMGGAIENVGARTAAAGVVGGTAMTALGGKLADTEVKSKSLFGQLSGMGRYLTFGLVAGLAAGTYEVGKLDTAFNNSTSAIAANANISQAAADRIGASFLKTSGTASFSARELATAYAQVGGQLGQVQGSALTSAQATTYMTEAWKLAEASGQGLNASTSNLAGTLQTYHMGVNQAATASNVLYNTSRLTGAGIDALTNVSGRLHGRIQQTMPSLQDMSAFMVDLADHGVRGSRGVMVVSQALNTLTSGSKNVNDMLASLGVHVFDAQGNFVGMESVLNQLQGPLSKLPPQLQLLAERTLFGAGAEQVMGSVVLSGSAAFDKARASVSQSNVVHEAAEKRLKALHGQWEVAKSAATNWGTEVGMHVVPILIRLATGFMHATEWIMRHRSIAIALAVVVGGVVVTAIMAYVVSMGMAAVATIAATWEILAIMAAVGVVVAGIVFLATHWHRVWTDIKNWVHDAYMWIRHHAILIGAAFGPIGLIVAEFATHWKFFWGIIKDAVHEVWIFIKPIIDAIKDAVGAVSKITGAVGHVGGAVGHAAGAVGHFLGFAEGGVVPGPVGAAQLAVVHGGELVVPAGAAATQISTFGTDMGNLGTALSPLTTTTGSGGGAMPAQSEALIINTRSTVTQPVGAGQPVVIQLVVDRKVLAQAVYSETAKQAART